MRIFSNKTKAFICFTIREGARQLVIKIEHSEPWVSLKEVMDVSPYFSDNYLTYNITLTDPTPSSFWLVEVINDISKQLLYGALEKREKQIIEDYLIDWICGLDA